ERAERVGRALVGAALEVTALLAATEAQVLEAEEAHLADARQQLLVGIEPHAELAGDPLSRRRPAERALEAMRGLLDQAGLLAHAARHPVERAQVVEDRAANAELRVGREGRLLAGIVISERVRELGDV